MANPLSLLLPWVVNPDPEAEPQVGFEQRSDLLPGQHTLIDHGRKTIITLGQLPTEDIGPELSFCFAIATTCSIACAKALKLANTFTS